MSPEKIGSLTLLSVAPQELDRNQLDAAKQILKKCELTTEEFNRIDKVLFEADKELGLNNDPIAAEKLFKTVREDILSCKYRPDGGPPFSETSMGIIADFVSIISGISSVVFGILRYKH